MTLDLPKTSICLFIIILHLVASVLSKGSISYEEDFETVVESDATQLVPNRKYIKSEGGKNFHIYCFSNVNKSFLQIWRSVQFELINEPNSFKIFSGVNESDVNENYRSNSNWNAFSLFSGSTSVVNFPAFSPYCVGIDTSDRYSFQLKVRTINYWIVLQTLLGTFLFVAAPGLSKNTFFHYTTGVSVGVLASILILLYILSRFIPQKGASYAVLVFGYSFILYFLKIIYHNFQDVVSHYMDIVLGYCIIAAFLSFVICYRVGPVTNERTLNIIQWSMQAVSLLCIFFSSEYREVSTAFILILLGLKIIPIQWFKWIKYIWYRCFPPKVKLLTEIEFMEQGNIETRKALEDLRKYCTSPDCKVWKVVRNLKDPIRFANFIENGNHYTDEELLEYNSDDFEDYVFDDAYENLNRDTYVD